MEHVLSEKLQIGHLFKIFPSFYETRKFVTDVTINCDIISSSFRWNQFRRSHQIYLFILILHSLLSLYLQSHFMYGFQSHPFVVSLMYATYLAYVITHYFINFIIQIFLRAQVTTHPFMYVSSATCTSFLVGTNIVLNTLLSNTVNEFHSLKVRDLH